MRSGWSLRRPALCRAERVDPVSPPDQRPSPGPGFAVDEDVDALGAGLVLPEWLEDEREAQLPEFDWSDGGRRPD